MKNYYAVFLHLKELYPILKTEKMAELAKKQPGGEHLFLVQK